MFVTAKYCKVTLHLQNPFPTLAKKMGSEPPNSEYSTTAPFTPLQHEEILTDLL